MNTKYLVYLAVWERLDDWSVSTPAVRIDRLISRHNDLREALSTAASYGEDAWVIEVPA